MSSEPAEGHSGPQEGQPGEHTPRPGQQEQQNHQQEASLDSWTLEVDPIQVDDDSFLSPEVRILLQQGAEATGLEVDEADEGDEGDDNAGSVYAMSMYPGTQPAFQVEHPYESGQDSATMCVGPFPLPRRSGCTVLTAAQRLGANIIRRGF